MRRCIACVHAAALVALASAGAGAQMPEGVVRDPAAATLSYADLERFADAFARLPAVRRPRHSSTPARCPLLRRHRLHVA